VAKSAAPLLQAGNGNLAKRRSRASIVGSGAGGVAPAWSPL